MNSVNNYGECHEIKKVDYAPFIEAMQIFNERFLSVYREYVLEHFKEVYEAYPDFFLFMKPIEWKVIFNNRSIDNYLYEGASDTFATFSNQFNTLGESREFYRLPDFKQIEKINNILGTTNEPLNVIRVKYGNTAPAIVLDEDYVTEDPNDMPSMGELEGRKYAKLHGEKARLEKYELFNLYGLNELVRKINSPSFEYELGESIKAYKAELYLAAAATGGIALENILRILITRKLGPEKLPDKTYIGNSITALREGNIIPGRFAGKILGQKEIRNSNMHTNEDPVNKETVEDLYKIIIEVIRVLI